MPPSRFPTFYLLGLFLLSWSSLHECQSASLPERPNVVFFIADDLGWTDLGCYGANEKGLYETPHLDRLASQSIQFTHAYSACTVCSPTRAALMTGKYPARLHITDWIAGHVQPRAKLKVPNWTMYLPHEEVTIAEVLRDRGYATAHIGKWHLGTEEYWPTTQGFDLNIGGTDRGQPPSYFFPYKRGNQSIATLQGGREGEYITDRLTDEATKFIEANQTKPFFLYLPHFAVHTPLEGKKEFVERFQAKLKSRPEPSDHSNATYAAMLFSLDESIGRIVETLERLRLSERTIVVFTSDNGGLVLNRVTGNAPLRAGKGSYYEGGVRVPLIVRWPGSPLTGTKSDTPVMSIDWLPTVADAVGAKVDPKSLNVDGVSLRAYVEHNKPIGSRPLYWHYPHYHPGGATPYGAILDGNFRLVEKYEDDVVELYDIRNDISEQRNLAQDRPDLAMQLRSKLRAWREAVGAQMPTPNR